MTIKQKKKEKKELEIKKLFWILIMKENKVVCMNSFVLGLSHFSFHLSNLFEYLSHVVCSILLLILCQWNTRYII